MRAWPLLLSLLAAALTVRPARASSPEDGGYGRLENDTSVELDLGAGLADDTPGGIAAIALRYLESVGLYGLWFDRFRGGGAVPVRTASVGVEVRPLFIPRFFKNLEHGPATLDLAIDSLSLRLGPLVWAEPDHKLTPAFEAGAAIGVPLCSATEGFWLSFATMLRWSHSEMQHDDHPSRAELPALFMVTLGYQLTTHLGVVNMNDELER